MYDYIIPLGRNCEIGIQLKRFYNFVEAFPFNWCAVNNYDGLCEILRNSHVLSENLTHLVKSNMFLDKSSGLCFHGNKHASFFKTIPQELYAIECQKEKETVISRINYLFGKLKRIQNNENKLLYIMTVHSIGNDPIYEPNDKLIKLINSVDCSLNRYKNYDLLVVISNHKYMFNIQYSDHIYIKSLRFFSPPFAVDRIELSDIDGWNEIFKTINVRNRPENKQYLFNCDFKTIFFKEGYLFLYPDVANHEYYSKHPLEHYKKFGIAENRDNGLHPSQLIFNGFKYCEVYKDINSVHINPWVHYVLYGFKEGRSNCVDKALGAVHK